jgi:hypothetical protein
VGSIVAFIDSNENKITTKEDKPSFFHIQQLEGQ